ncbi:radical SAM/SPASM domain-containing protein [Streptomyces sp. NPDC021096]|uniref:radical SAM/SPASM domain-containing protein n=1 Tax=Streptomyces sp. NPDC021096 TaxID=3154792 RepID=UPI0033EC24F7
MAPAPARGHQEGKPTMTTVTEQPHLPVQPQSVQLELATKCPSRCGMCFVAASPQGTHGTMTLAEWLAVISEAAELDIPMVQLLGGEPTLHPHWIELMDHALALGRRVEVYTTLHKIHERWWDVLAHKNVSLATSYHSDDPDEHDRITGKPGSHARTRANIQEAVRRGIPLRAGIVEVLPGQRVTQARDDLVAMGITRVRIDRSRAIGRAATAGEPDVSELCGRCGRGQLAVLPDGSVAPCVMSRFMPAGSVKDGTLTAILNSPAWWNTVERVPARAQDPCDPDCNPGLDGSDCAPAEQEACDPAYADIPDQPEQN